jgi:hypothetical protein
MVDQVFFTEKERMKVKQYFYLVTIVCLFFARIKDQLRLKIYSIYDVAYHSVLYLFSLNYA